MQALSVTDPPRLGISSIGAPVLILLILAMMVLPLPAVLLDGLFSFNISLSLIVVLVVVYTRSPLEFSVFPTVLLVTTLLRLSLNVASTRVVLLNGHEGPDAAGRVIEAFGEFVVGGNYVVGLVVFAILVLINFVVITKGAGRISEVSARFTLDAMPGKQMAIDADLNAGLVTQEEARARRQEVGEEADFFGAMDGASKFVRGDAIAGLLILLINIVGGLAVGILQHGLSTGEAGRIYTLLAIGDGLVAQIPALVLSTGAAMMVTRVSSSNDVGNQIGRQLFSNPAALYVAAGVLATMGLIPGMPNAAFLTLACIVGGAGYVLKHRAETQQPAMDKDREAAESRPTRELDWEDIAPVDSIALEVGYRLVPLVDVRQGGQLMERIRGVRKKLTHDIGFLIPSVHIKDNLEIAPGGYRIALNGVVMGEAEVHPDRDLAINPGKTYGEVKGIDTQDPAFGLEAKWIERTHKDHAQSLGYTIVDPATVIATHLSHLVVRRAHDLFGIEEAQKILDALARSAPKLAEELVPKTIPLGVFVRVLQNLLEEQVSIRDTRKIADSLAEYGAKSQDPEVLTALVRSRLGSAIVQQIFANARELNVITLNQQLVRLLHDNQSIMEQKDQRPLLEPGLAERLVKSLTDATRTQLEQGRPAVLLTPPNLRPVLARLVRNVIPELRVLAFNEMPDDKQIRIVATATA